VNALTAP
jgi:SET domain-containing protein 6